MVFFCSSGSKVSFIGDAEGERPEEDMFDPPEENLEKPPTPEPEPEPEEVEEPEIDTTPLPASLGLTPVAFDISNRPAHLPATDEIDTAITYLAPEGQPPVGEAGEGSNYVRTIVVYLHGEARTAEQHFLQVISARVVSSAKSDLNAPRSQFESDSPRNRM